MVEVGRQERQRAAVVDELIRKGGTRWDPVDYLKTDEDL